MTTMAERTSTSAPCSARVISTTTKQTAADRPGSGTSRAMRESATTETGALPAPGSTTTAMGGFLFHNERNGTFREEGVESGVAYDEDGNAHSGMGTDTGDLLNDGKTWVAIANFQGQQTSLYREGAAQGFEDVRQRAGVGP